MFERTMAVQLYLCRGLFGVVKKGTQRMSLHP